MNNSSSRAVEQGASEESEPDGAPSTSLNSQLRDVKSSENMGKRAAARQRIERYYYQLKEGCGQENCTNNYCASSKSFSFKDITNDDAGLKAIELFKSHALLCDQQPSKLAKNTSTTESVDNVAGPSSNKHQNETSERNVQCNITASTSSNNASSNESLTSLKPDESAQGLVAASATIQPPISSVSMGQQVLAEAGKPLSSSPSSENLAIAEVLAKFASATKGREKEEYNISPSKPEVPYLTEEKLNEVIEKCSSNQESKNWSLLKSTIYSVFNNSQALKRSFRKELSAPENKEALRSMEIDLDKDRDDQANSATGDSKEIYVPVKHSECSLDLASLRRAYNELFSIPDVPFQDVLINAIDNLSKEMDLEMKYYSPYENDPNYLNIFLIILEIPHLFHPEFIEAATPRFLRITGMLPITAQAKLARLWSKYPIEWLKDFLHGLQQLITVKCITTEWTRNYVVNDNVHITGAVRVMKVLYYACVLGGCLDPPELLEAEKEFLSEIEVNLNELYQGAIARDQKERNAPKEDPLAKELGINVLSCRKPLIELTEFVNEPLSDAIEMDKDFTYYKTDTYEKFSFMNHSFAITTAVKNLGLYYDNRIRMIEERRTSIVQSFIHGGLHMPYLKLRIRRDHIIDDALVNLEMAAMDNPQDLKKQLYVEFEGEQGIDEGGVSKEFFQLVVDEIFNPDIGMFTQNEETKNCWFNSSSYENQEQFTLIGIVLGLAIYNNIILDIHFPPVVYRKLLGKKGTFEDLKSSHPTLAKSLQDLLDFEGCIEETFMQTFQISYSNVFGEIITEDLKPEGNTIAVTQNNKQEYVELYADFLLNKSISKQFQSFYRGFHMVTDESPLKMLFRPVEIELLVCGSKHFDFHSLEETTEYDGGFSETSSTIRHFWEIVHEFTDDQKSKLLQFTTGSDRCPVGGLSKLKLIIARNGPDSERLPTAHTCFNVLLLPDYSNKKKLEERLLKAITYAKGFGML